MSNSTITVKSFKDMGAALAREQHRRDMEAAARLRRSQPLRKGRKGIAVVTPKPVI